MTYKAHNIAELKVARIRALISEADAKEYVISLLDHKLGDSSDNQAMGICAPAVPSKPEIVGLCSLHRRMS